ncbi:hypothetical protein [Serratia liquefaciens]|uniref:hypothetical protein n=1 Tax=Serratia liquefaciens TaxID=614 RepID=UPI0021C7348E|nr:hypothetical protein [Serratia liquefaciens]
MKDIVKSKLDGCINEFGKESNLKLLASDLEFIKKENLKNIINTQHDVGVVTNKEQ